MGSQGVAASIAQVVFAALLLVGVCWGELGIKRATLFGALWVAGYVSFPLISLGGFNGLGASLFSPYVAVLDIILVFLVLKGDLRLS